jgi:hypothetical protein
MCGQDPAQPSAGMVFPVLAELGTGLEDVKRLDRSWLVAEVKGNSANNPRAPYLLD